MSQSGEPEPQAEVLEAFWSREQAAQFFADLEQHAEVHRVQVRASNSSAASQDGESTLVEANQLLRDNLAQAIQVYYKFEGKAWCDTLFPSEDSIRVVRTILPDDRLLP